ncbi:MAG TPA: hypothetical protein VH701_21065 [Vicinamibacterales bacterium]
MNDANHAASDVGDGGMRRWLENWARVGPVLEAERWARLRRMTDDEARDLTRAVLALWRRSERDELGAELVTEQHWFMKAARSPRAR